MAGLTHRLTDLHCHPQSRTTSVAKEEWKWSDLHTFTCSTVFYAYFWHLRSVSNKRVKYDGNTCQINTMDDIPMAPLCLSGFEISDMLGEARSQQPPRNVIPSVAPIYKAPICGCVTITACCKVNVFVVVFEECEMWPTNELLKEALDVSHAIGHSRHFKPPWYFFFHFFSLWLSLFAFLNPVCFHFHQHNVNRLLNNIVNVALLLHYGPFARVVLLGFGDFFERERTLMTPWLSVKPLNAAGRITPLPLHTAHITGNVSCCINIS